MLFHEVGPEGAGKAIELGTSGSGEVAAVELSTM